MFLKQPKRFGFMSLRQCGKNRFTVLQGFPVLQSLSVIASLACSGMFITPSFEVTCTGENAQQHIMRKQWKKYGYWSKNIAVRGRHISLSFQ